MFWMLCVPGVSPAGFLTVLTLLSNAATSPVSFLTVLASFPNVVASPLHPPVHGHQLCFCMLLHAWSYSFIWCDWWCITNAATIFQNMSKIFYWSHVDTLFKPASISTARLPIWNLGNNVLKCILCKNHHRSNRLSLTTYAIVFYACFSPALEVQKSVMFYTLLIFSQFTKKLWPDILSMVF